MKEEIFMKKFAFVVGIAVVIGIVAVKAYKHYQGEEDPEGDE